MRIVRIGLLSTLPLIAGCGWSSYTTVDETRTSMAVLDETDALEVRTRNGAIVVTRGDVDEVTITAVLKARTDERLQAMRVTTEEHDGRLVVGAEPADGVWKSGEGVRFEIVVPRVSGVTLDSSNGAIRIEGLSGLADLTTSNGAVVVRDHAGDVRVDTSNGRVELNGVEGAADVRTSNGAIIASDLHAGATLRTSNGRINLSLADDAAGPVDLSTSNGAVRLELGDAFAGSLSASTVNGRLHVEGASAAEITSQSKRRVDLVIGDAGPESRVRTSNGSLTIRLPG